MELACRTLLSTTVCADLLRIINLVVCSESAGPQNGNVLDHVPRVDGLLLCDHFARRIAATLPAGAMYLKVAAIAPHFGFLHFSSIPGLSLVERPIRFSSLKCLVYSFPYGPASILIAMVTRRKPREMTSAKIVQQGMIYWMIVRNRPSEVMFQDV